MTGSDDTPETHMAFYDRMHRAVAEARAPRPGEASGFAAPEDDAVLAELAWRPVGTLPRELVAEDYGQLQRVRIAGRTVELQLRPAPRHEAWMRHVFSTAPQPVAAVIDGRTETTAMLSYAPARRRATLRFDLPDGLDPAARIGIEVERDGRLVFSGYLSPHDNRRAPGLTPPAPPGGLLRRAYGRLPEGLRMRLGPVLQSLLSRIR